MSSARHLPVTTAWVVASGALATALLLGGCGGGTTAADTSSNPAAASAAADSAGDASAASPAAEEATGGAWAPPLPTGVDPAEDIWVSLGADPSTKDAESLANACAALPLPSYTEDDFKNAFLAFYPMSSLEEWNAVVDYINANLPAYCG